VLAVLQYSSASHGDLGPLATRSWHVPAGPGFVVGGGITGLAVARNGQAVL